MFLSGRLIAFCLLTLSTISVAGSIEFSSVDLSGKEHRLSDYKGKWIIVNYWATWCPPCIDEIPELVEFHKRHAKTRAVVLGVNYENIDDAYLHDFIKEYLISYPVLKADLNRTPPFGRVQGLPTTFIISPDGKLVETRVGVVSLEWLESIIKPEGIKQI